MEPYLYHGIRDHRFDRLINILKTGYIFPKNMLSDKYKIDRSISLDLNGNCWISLGQKSLIDDYYRETCPNSFDDFIYNHLCIVVNPNIEGIRYTNHIWYDSMSHDDIIELISDESIIRYSTLMDEVQTNKPISTRDFIAIGYPQNRSNRKKELEELKETLLKQQLPIPVVDSSRYDFADDVSKIKKYTL